MAESEPKLNLTQTQEYIIARHSKMVGKVLDLIEASLPEGNQCDKLKKLLQVPLYDFRNEMIQLDAKGFTKYGLNYKKHIIIFSFSIGFFDFRSIM